MRNNTIEKMFMNAINWQAVEENADTLAEIFGPRPGTGKSKAALQVIAPEETLQGTKVMKWEIEE